MTQFAELASEDRAGLVKKNRCRCPWMKSKRWPSAHPDHTPRLRRRPGARSASWDRPCLCGNLLQSRRVDAQRQNTSSSAGADDLEQSRRRAAVFITRASILSTPFPSPDHHGLCDETDSPCLCRMVRRSGCAFEPSARVTKMAKYVMRIEAVEDFAKRSLRQRAGYWEDRGYEWYAGI